MWGDRCCSLCVCVSQEDHCYVCRCIYEGWFVPCRMGHANYNSPVFIIYIICYNFMLIDLAQTFRYDNFALIKETPLQWSLIRRRKWAARQIDTLPTSQQFSILPDNWEFKLCVFQSIVGVFYSDVLCDDWKLLLSWYLESLEISFM